MRAPLFQTPASKKVLAIVYNKFTNDSRVLKQCTSLVKAGYKVELWANYSSELPNQEVINGFTVVRKLHKPALKKHDRRIRMFWKNARKSILRPGMILLKSTPWLYRICKSIVNSIEWVLVSLVKGFLSIIKKIRKAVTVEKQSQAQVFDIVHCNDLAPLPFAVELKSKHPNLKIIYDCHEHETESAGIVKIPEKKKRYEDLERQFIPYADKVITVSESIADDYKQMYQLNEVAIVKNMPEFFQADLSNRYFRDRFKLKDDDIIFLYQGALLKGFRGIEETLQAFVSLSEEGFNKHHIVFMGYGRMEGEIQSYVEQYKNIHFHPAVKPEEIPIVSPSADYGIIFIHNICKSYNFALPNKLFEYIMCGLPVVSTPLHEISKVVRSEDLGLLTENFEAGSLLNALKSIDKRPTQEMRHRIKNLHKEKYNWSIEEKTLVELYKTI